MNWLEFDWDEGNEDKVPRRVSEKELRETFTDPDQIDREAYIVEGERRWTFFAKTWEGRIMFVVYTMREDKVRVISAREAEDDEKRIYQRGWNEGIMKKIKNWNEIPEFETENEEREFWETHSISPDLADDFDRPAQGPMARKMREARAMVPNLDEDTFRRLIELSVVESVDPRDLITRFIADGLREEEKRAGLTNHR